MQINIRIIQHPLPLLLCYLHRALRPTTSCYAQIVENTAIRIDIALLKEEEWWEKWLRNQKHSINLTKKHPKRSPRLQTPFLALHKRFVYCTKMPMGILEVNANIFQALPATTSASFAGIASTPVPAESYSIETLELEGWMASYNIKDLSEITLPSMPIPITSASRTWHKKAWSKVCLPPFPISPHLSVYLVSLANRWELRYPRNVKRGGGWLDD